MKKRVLIQKLLLAWLCSFMFIELFADLAPRVVAPTDYVPIKWGIVVLGNFDYCKYPSRQNAIQKAEHWVQSEGIPYDIIEDDVIEAPTDAPSSGKYPLQYADGRTRYGVFVLIMNHYTDSSAQNLQYVRWAAGNGTNAVIFGMAGRYVPELLNVSQSAVSYFADYSIITINCKILQTFSDGLVEYQRNTTETIAVTYYMHANLSDTEGKTVYYTMHSNTGKEWTGMVQTTYGSAKVFWCTLLPSHDRFFWHGALKEYWETRNLKFVGHAINFMFEQVKRIDLSIQGYKKWGGAVTYRLDMDTHLGIIKFNETAMQEGWYYDVVVCALGYLTDGGWLTDGLPDGYGGAPSSTVKHGDFTGMVEDFDPLTFTSRKFLVYNSTEGGIYDRIRLDYNRNQDFSDDVEYQIWENQTHGSVKGAYYWCYINDWRDPTSVKLGWWCPLRERHNDFSWWKTQGQEDYLAYGFHGWQHQFCGNASLNSHYVSWNGSQFLLNETWVEQKFTEARNELAYCLGSSGYGFDVDEVLVSHAGNECPTEVANVLFNLSWVGLTYGDNGMNEPSWFFYDDRKDAMSFGGGETLLNDVSCIEAVADCVKTLWPILGVYAHGGHYNLTYDVYPPNTAYTDMFRFVHLDESYKFYTNKRYMLMNTAEAYYMDDRLVLEYRANSTFEEYVWKFPIEYNGRYLNTFSDNRSIGKMRHFDGTHAFVEFSQGEGGQQLEVTYSTNPCIYETFGIDEITQTFSDDELTLIISGQSGVTSTTSVYCGDEGEPTEVYATNGSLAWSYNNTVTMLTLNVTFHSQAEVVVSWRTHDLAVNNVIPSKTVVDQSYSMFIAVTVENQGNYSRAFNVTAYANTIVIDTVTNITLAGGSSMDITFTWDTTESEIENYTISAYVTPVPGEFDIDDNEFIDGMVQVTIPGDVNGDGVVDILDLSTVALSYGKRLGQPGYDPYADITNDGMVDLRDLALVTWHWG